MSNKQWEKLLDGFMGLAYSFAAISAGISVYEHNFDGYIRAVWAILLMFIIAKFYKEANQCRLHLSISFQP